MHHLKRFYLSIFIFSLFLALLILTAAYAINHAAASPTTITDPDLIIAPESRPRPAAGTPFTDTAFNTTLRRLSTASDDGTFETHEYSQLQAFSTDGRYVLTYLNGWYTVRRLSNLTIVDGLNTAAWNIARWHPTRPHTLVHFDTNGDEILRLQFTNVETAVTETVYTFPAPYTRINVNRSSEDLSRNGRWLSGLARRSDGDQTLFTLDLENLELAVEHELNGDLYSGPCAPDPTWGPIEPDWVGVSPLGNYLVIQWERDGTTRCSGLETFDIQTGEFTGRVTDGHQHGDLGVSADGLTEFFMTFELYHPSGNASIGYRTLPGTDTVAEPTYPLVLDDWIGDHISCRGPNGVCLVTTRAETANGWQPLEGEIFLLYLDGAVERLTHHRSTECHYWMQPRASLSADGRRAIFSSDWGIQPGQCSGSENIVGVGDAYIIELEEVTLPVEPYSDIFLPVLLNGAAASTPIPTPTASPTPAPSPTPSPSPSPPPTAGTPAFTQAPIATDVIHGQDVNIIDLDQDGDQDIILAHSLEDGITLYRNSGDGTTWDTLDIVPDNTIVAMDTTVADFDGDGDLDVAAVGLFDRAPCGWGSGAFCEAPGAVTWFENPGNVSGTWIAHPIATDLWGPITIEHADLTGNGRLDLIVGTVTLFGRPDGLFWFRHNTDGSWSTAQTITTQLENVYQIAIHDVDQDSVPDITAVSTTSDQIIWYENGRTAATPTDTLTFTPHTLSFEFGSPISLAFANLDDDPAVELAIIGASGVQYLDPTAVITAPWNMIPVAPQYRSGNNGHVITADFDNDGDQDIASTSDISSGLSWFEQTTNGWESHFIGNYSGITGLAAGDLDGNGRPDLATTTYNNNSGTDRIDWWQNE